MSKIGSLLDPKDEEGNEKIIKRVMTTVMPNAAATPTREAQFSSCGTEHFENQFKPNITFFNES